MHQQKDTLSYRYAFCKQLCVFFHSFKNIFLSGFLTQSYNWISVICIFFVQHQWQTEISALERESLKPHSSIDQQWFCLLLSYLHRSWRRLLSCLGSDSPVSGPCCCAWLWGSAAASCSDGCTRRRCSSPAGQIGRGSAGPPRQQRPCSPCQTALPSTVGRHRSWCQL